MKTYDLVIEGGDIMVFAPDKILKDHSLGVSQGKISILSEKPLCGRKTIDATGCMVMPGFIDFHSHVDGKRFSAECLVRQGATTTIGGGRNFDGIAIRKIMEHGFLINHGFFVSHSFTLRKAVGIDDPYRKATKEEIKGMVALAEKFFQGGAFGIHFALELVPGTSEEELLAMAETAKRHGRVMLIHMRKDGMEARNTLEEIFRIIKRTKVSVHILHLIYMLGMKDIMEQALEKIEQVRAEGYDITADTGIYGAFPSCIGSSILDGNWWEKYQQGVSMKDVVISSGIYAGQACTSELFAYLREEFPNTLVTVFVLDEGGIPVALQREYVYVSTNAADGPHYECIGHPETAGTFPKLLQKYVVETHTLPLIEAVKKITCLPARRFSIKGKGEIKVGFDADLTIVDLSKVQACADYVNRGDPNAPPKGIPWVVVNGQVVTENARIHSNLNPGRLLEF